MSIETTIRSNMYQAMKEHNNLHKQIYSMALQAIQKVSKDKQKVLTDDEVTSVLKKEVKSYHETLEFAEKSGHTDTINECNTAINLLSQYLPQELSEGQIRSIVNSIAMTIAPLKRNKGMFMKQLKGTPGIDMKIAGKIVDEILK